MTTFYFRKIKDEHRMSEATNKEVGFSDSQQHFQLLWYLMPHIFNSIK